MSYPFGDGFTVKDGHVTFGPFGPTFDVQEGWLLVRGHLGEPLWLARFGPDGDDLWHLALDGDRARFVYRDLDCTEDVNVARDAVFHLRQIDGRWHFVWIPPARQRP